MNFQPEYFSPTQVEAFRFLQGVVQDLSSSGKRRLGAFLKPELIRRSGGSFNEASLGYQKFADFLRAAEAARYIRLEASGLDLEASLPTSAASSPTPSANSTPRLSQAPPISDAQEIRRDFWDAFVDFSPGQLRIYDKNADKALKVPELAYPGEPHEFSMLRSRVLKHEDGLIPIRPIQPHQLISWMESFATESAGPLSANLLSALRGEHALHEFTRLVRSDPFLHRKWSLERIQKVAEYIQSWLGEKGIQTQVLVPRAPRRGTVVRPPLANQGGTSGQAWAAEFAELTGVVDAIDSAIDRLLRLRGALTYMNKKSGREM